MALDDYTKTRKEFDAAMGNSAYELHDKNLLYKTFNDISICGARVHGKGDRDLKLTYSLVVLETSGLISRKNGKYSLSKEGEEVKKSLSKTQ